MNIHILFCPARTIAPDGRLLPTASLALTLDDEVQYRCAGFIQAEIEQFSEDAGDEPPAANTSDEGLTSEGDLADVDEPKRGKSKPTKRKKAAKGGATGDGPFLPSRLPGD
jgi:cohesin complex subunit SA-1/2